MAPAQPTGSAGINVATTGTQPVTLADIRDIINNLAARGSQPSAKEIRVAVPPYFSGDIEETRTFFGYEPLYPV